MRLIFYFLACVVILNAGSLALAMTVYTDSSYLPAIKNEIDQAHASINIWINLISVDKNPDDPVIALIDSLERTALRGIPVNLNIPSGAISRELTSELRLSGIKVLRLETYSPMVKIVIDDKVFLGTHSWTREALTKFHAITFCFDPMDKISLIPEHKINNTILNTIENAEGYIYLALNNPDNFSGKFRMRLINLLENKAVNQKSISVLMEQSFISSFSVQHLYSAQGKNVKEAAALYQKKVPVFLDPYDSYFNYELYLMDSDIIFGIEPTQQKKGIRAYYSFKSIDLALRLRSYVDALPKIAVKDIFTYY